MQLGVILAGGAGSRLGGNKTERMLGATSLLAHVITRLDPQVNALALNGPQSALQHHNLPCLEDPEHLQGPVAGLWAALDHAASIGAQGLLVAPCDMPFLPRDLASRLAHTLAEGDDDKGIAIPHAGEAPVWTVSYWAAPKRSFADLKDLLSRADGQSKARAFKSGKSGFSLRSCLQALGARIVENAFDPADLMNVNTAEDLDQAQSRLG